MDLIRDFYSLAERMLMLYNGIFRFGTVISPNLILKNHVPGLKKHDIWKKYVYLGTLNLSFATFPKRCSNYTFNTSLQW